MKKKFDKVEAGRILLSEYEKFKRGGSERAKKVRDLEKKDFMAALFQFAKWNERDRRLM